jgi:peptidoglycan/LPS O-acetylase OafA/YrhL
MPWSRLAIEDTFQPEYRGVIKPRGTNLPMKYQPHIDGLRAVAVMAVILFHFGIPGLQGGYIGVDVFFVISGYLITKLILEEVRSTGSFRFWRFYARRIRRLFPALLATCLVTAIVAGLLFTPQMFADFGLSLTGAVLSFSNIVFWWESGYWDEASYLKPLLHTWSLGVEEQFYYIWPALMVLGPALGFRRAFLPILLAVGVASFAANLIWVGLEFDPDYAATIFFWMPFRIFEFVLGAVGVFAARWPKNALVQEAGMAAGLAMIVVSVVTFSDKLVFPSYYALLPCTGALLVIMSGEARFAGALVRNTVAIWIGLVSYSLYLVHWPVFVFYRYYTLKDPSGGMIAVLLLATFVLAYALHEWVEKPFYKRGAEKSPRAPAMARALIPSSMAAMAILALLGLQIGTSDGWAWRQPGVLTASQVAEAKERRYQIREAACLVEDLAIEGRDASACKMDRPLQVLFVGNSHELDALNAFHVAYGDNEDINLIRFGTFNGCNMKIRNGVPVSDHPGRQCKERFALLSDKDFVSQLDVVVYGSLRPFSHTKGKSFRLLRHLKDQNPDIAFVVMGGYFISMEPCAELVARFGSAERCKDRPGFFDGYARDRRKLKEKDLVDYLYIDKKKLLCPEGTIKSCEYEANGEPMFYDRNHLSFGFVRRVGERMAEVYEKELGALGFRPAGEQAAEQHALGGTKKQPVP